MKRILRYRIVWEDGVNANYVGPKAVSIETPDYLKIKIAYCDEHKFFFGNQRIECDIEDTVTGQIETKILYREFRNKTSGEIRYRITNAATGWEVKDINGFDTAREDALRYIGKIIKQNNDDYDYFKTNEVPSVMAFDYEIEIKKYRVENRNTCVKEDFNTMEEVLEFLKDQPFGVELSRLDEHGHAWDFFYTEELQEENNEFYVLNTLKELEFDTGTDPYDGCPDYVTVDEYGSEPLYFKDLQELRRYILPRLDGGKSEYWDYHFVRGECFTTIESSEDGEE